MKSLDGVTVITAILIISFAIDRVVTGVLFPLLLLQSFPDPSRSEADARKYKLIYFCAAALLAVIVLAAYPKVRFLQALGFGTEVNPALDAFLTGVVFIAGADRIASLLKLPSDSGATASEPKPIQISGKLTLEESPAPKSASTAR